MLVQSRQNFDKIAGAVAVIKLTLQYFIPSIFACARTTRQRKKIRSVANATCRAALDCTGANFLHGDSRENGAKGVYFFFIDIPMRFYSDIAPRQSGTTRRDYHIDLRICAPSAQLSRDFGPLIGQDFAVSQNVARSLDPPDQYIARPILGQRPAVTYR